MSNKIDILIIEDDTFIGMDISSTIEDLGHKVINLVTNFKDAIDEIKDNKVDLIISDINIDGEKDGIDAVKVIQSVYNVPAIFITSFNDDETLLKASEANMLGYIVKPYKDDDLISLVKIAQMKASTLTTQLKIELSKEYSYNTDTKKLFYNLQEIKFSLREKLLFDLLFYERGKFVSYDVVESIVWFGEVVSDNSRRQLFHRLKSKLEGLEFESGKNSGYKLKQ